MTANQPRNQLRFPRVQPVQLSEFQHVLRAKNRVIATATFSNIVEKRSHQQQFGLRKARIQLHAQRMFRASFFMRKAFDFLQNADRMFIHRVGMEQIELHLADNLSPLRHVRPQHAVPVHRHQCARDSARMAKDRHKHFPRLRDHTKRFFQMTACMAQKAHGGGVNPFDFAMTDHQMEHTDDRFRLAFKQRVVAQIDQIPSQLEMLIQRTRFLVRAYRENRFIEQLQ